MTRVRTSSACYADWSNQDETSDCTPCGSFSVWETECTRADAFVLGSTSGQGSPKVLTAIFERHLGETTAIDLRTRRHA